jgi:8-oxo-dGTP diphosphatase
VDLGERTEDAAVREIREETGLVTRPVRLVGVYSDPARDPRRHVVSVVYELKAVSGQLEEGSDARKVILIDPEGPPRLAFDHETILADWRGLRDHTTA